MISLYFPLSNNFPKKPFIDPDKINIPSGFLYNSDNLQWGSESASFSRYDFDDSSTILLYPCSFRAIKGISPIVSSCLKFIWVPTIGWVPALEMFSANSKDPHKLDVSDRPTHLIFFSLQNSFKLSILSLILILLNILNLLDFLYSLA